MDIKKVKLKDVAKYSNKKIEIEKISVNTYISTENMLPYRSGIGIASSLPNQKTVTLVEKNNVLISNIRPYFKKIWFSNFNGGCSNDVLNIQVIDPNIILPEFLYYTLMSDNFFDYVMSSVKGTKMPRGDKDQIMNYELELPNLKKQHNIVEYLSNLDKKIELNNQTNDNLQELMNYDYQEYKRDIEDGVSIPIKEILEFETGVEPGSKNYSSIQHDNYIKFYRVGDMNTVCNNYVPRELTKGKIAKKDDVLVSFDATIGRIAYGINGAFSTGMKNIKPQKEYEDIITKGFIYTYFNDSSVKDILEQNAIGTTILHASGSINHLDLKYDEEKIKKLSSKLDLMFSKMKQIKEENETLTQLRDTLLPKLMNGEIDLDNIEI